MPYRSDGTINSNFNSNFNFDFNVPLSLFKCFVIVFELHQQICMQFNRMHYQRTFYKIKIEYSFVDGKKIFKLKDFLAVGSESHEINEHCLVTRQKCILSTMRHVAHLFHSLTIHPNFRTFFISKISDTSLGSQVVIMK